MRNSICSLTLNPAIDKTVYIDDFSVDNVNRVDDSCQIPGSKGINVARILAQCSLKSICSGFIGFPNGQYVIDEIRKDGVIDDFVRVDFDVRTNIKIVDLKNSTYTDINFAGGEPKTEDVEKLKDKVRVLAKESALVALGGSLPAGVDNSVYRELALIAKSEGAAVSLDCYGKCFTEALEAKPFVVKPNLEELEITFSEKYDNLDQIIERAMKIYEGGVENVLVSLGRDGAVCVCGGDVMRLYTDDLTVYNTVGAGDAFLSGFIYGWHKGLGVVDCLRHSLSFSEAIVSGRADEKRDIDMLTRYVNSARVEVLGTRR